MQKNKRNLPKRPHNVIRDWREWTKPNRAKCMEARRADVQRDTFFYKPIPGNADLIAFPVKNRVGEWHMEGLRIGYQLYGTVFGFFGSVNGGNDGECSMRSLLIEMILASTLVNPLEGLP